MESEFTEPQGFCESPLSGRGLPKCGQSLQSIKDHQANISGRYRTAYTDCGGVNRIGPHRFMCLKAWPTGSDTIWSCVFVGTGGLVGESVSLWSLVVEPWVSGSILARTERFRKEPGQSSWGMCACTLTRYQQNPGYECLHPSSSCWTLTTSSCSFGFQQHQP